MTFKSRTDFTRQMKHHWLAEQYRINLLATNRYLTKALEQLQTNPPRDMDFDDVLDLPDKTYNKYAEMLDKVNLDALNKCIDYCQQLGIVVGPSSYQTAFKNIHGSSAINDMQIGSLTVKDIEQLDLDKVVQYKRDIGPVLARRAQMIEDPDELHEWEYRSYQNDFDKDVAQSNLYDQFIKCERVEKEFLEAVE